MKRFYLILFHIVVISQSCQQQQNPYLVGYQASDIYLNYQKQGFQLDSGVRTFQRNSKKIKEWFLKKETPSEEYHILVYGDSEGKLEKIVLSVVFKNNKTAIHLENKTFFKVFIKRYYKDEPISWVLEWLDENLGKESRFTTTYIDFYTNFDESNNSLILALHPL